MSKSYWKNKSKKGAADSSCQIDEQAEPRDSNCQNGRKKRHSWPDEHSFDPTFTTAVPHSLVERGLLNNIKRRVHHERISAEQPNAVEDLDNTSVVLRWEIESNYIFGILAICFIAEGAEGNEEDNHDDHHRAEQTGEVLRTFHGPS